MLQTKKTNAKLIKLNKKQRDVYRLLKLHAECVVKGERDRIIDTLLNIALLVDGITRSNAMNILYSFREMGIIVPLAESKTLGTMVALPITAQIDVSMPGLYAIIDIEIKGEEKMSTDEERELLRVYVSEHKIIRVSELKDLTPGLSNNQIVRILQTEGFVCKREQGKAVWHKTDEKCQTTLSPEITDRITNLISNNPAQSFSMKEIIEAIGGNIHRDVVRLVLNKKGCIYVKNDECKTGKWLFPGEKQVEESVHVTISQEEIDQLEHQEEIDKVSAEEMIATATDCGLISEVDGRYMTPAEAKRFSGEEGFDGPEVSEIEMMEVLLLSQIEKNDKAIQELSNQAKGLRDKADELDVMAIVKSRIAEKLQLALVKVREAESLL